MKRLRLLSFLFVRKIRKNVYFQNPKSIFMILRLFICLLLPLSIFCQSEKKYKLRCVAFYNVENLFDTKNDSLIFDDDRTPKGAYKWNEKRYGKKIANISKVISKIGGEIHTSPPDVIGLCEIENRNVLNDLVGHPNLRMYDYGILHFDSPDHRGIDVALLYQKSSFLPTAFVSRRLLIKDELGNRKYTRDQLVVEGILDNETFYFLVNHWPSRRGGEQKSRPNRLKAAQLNKQIIDSLRYLNPDSKIISMGDFNDDPKNASFRKVLKTKGNVRVLDSLDLYNPSEELYKKGLGSLAYRDKWNLFDQFYMTSNLTEKSKGYFLWKTALYTPNFLRTPNGKYIGYPFRTYSGTNYIGGYSDHFPIYLFLIREQL